MPVQQTHECDFCGRTNDIEKEKCSKCGKFKNEDPEEYQKHLDDVENNKIENVD